MAKATKIIPVESLRPLNLRLVVQRNSSGFDVVNGCYRFCVLQDFGIAEVPVIEYSRNEDPVQLVLRTQEADNSVQLWDFLNRVFLAKRLYEELGTLDVVAEKMEWKDKSNAHHYLRIANLSEDALTAIRNSVSRCSQNTVNVEADHGQWENLDNIWSVRWFKFMLTSVGRKKQPILPGCFLAQGGVCESK